MSSELQFAVRWVGRNSQRNSEVLPKPEVAHIFSATGRIPVQSAGGVAQPQTKVRGTQSLRKSYVVEESAAGLPTVARQPVGHRLLSAVALRLLRAKR